MQAHFLVDWIREIRAIRGWGPFGEGRAQEKRSLLDVDSPPRRSSDRKRLIRCVAPWRSRPSRFGPRLEHW